MSAWNRIEELSTSIEPVDHAAAEHEAGERSANTASRPRPRRVVRRPLRLSDAKGWRTSFLSI